MASYNVTLNMDNPRGNGLDVFALPFMLVQNAKLYAYITQRTDRGRPDRICLKIWGDGNLVPHLCKLNALYNPYSLREGQLILLCQKSDLELVLSTPELEQIITDTRRTLRSNNTIQNAILQSKNIQAAITTSVSENTSVWLAGETILPPNAPRSSSPNIEINGSKIIFR